MFPCTCILYTCSSLKGIYGFVYASCCGAVLPRSDLRVQSTDIEQNAAFLEGQRALARWDTCQRVVPERQTTSVQLMMLSTAYKYSSQLYFLHFYRLLRETHNQMCSKH